MPLQVGIGFSNHPDPKTAAEEAAAQAKKQLKRERIDAALVFNTSHYEPREFLPPLFETLDKTALVGSTTSEIILSNSIEPAGIALLLLTSDLTKFESGQVSHLPLQDLEAAGKKFVRECTSEFGLSAAKLFLFFMDGMVEAPERFLDGIKGSLGHRIPILAAGSKASSRFPKTYQYHFDQISSASASGLILGGNCHMGMACAHGWKPLGQPRTITAAHGATVTAINNQKAVTLYEHLFPATLPSWDQECLNTLSLRYPLGMRRSDGNYVIRNILTKLDDGSLVCQDKVNEGATIHVMIQNKRSCLQDAELATYQVREQLAGVAPKFVLVIESFMRRALLGRVAAQEIRSIRSILGDNVPLIGMCSRKEIFVPLRQKDSQIDIQNSSLIILAVG